MRFGFFLILLFSASAYAELNCEVSLNYGLVVADKQIRVLGHGGRTVYQINGRTQLFVQGEWIHLDEKQERKLAELSSGIHKVVPKMIVLANEGVELAVATIEKVYSGLVKDDASQQKLQKSLDRVRMSVKHKFIRANNLFYMGPGRVEQVDDLVDKELEEEIEALISTSVGGVLSAISGLVASEKSTEEKIEEIAKQLEAMGEELERSVEPKAEMLKHKAKWFCKKFKYLDKVEDELKDSIKELRHYDVLLTQREHIE